MLPTCVDATRMLVACHKPHTCQAPCKACRKQGGRGTARWPALAAHRASWAMQQQRGRQKAPTTHHISSDLCSRPCAQQFRPWVQYPQQLCLWKAHPLWPPPGRHMPSASGPGRCVLIELTCRLDVLHVEGVPPAGVHPVPRGVVVADHLVDGGEGGAQGGGAGGHHPAADAGGTDPHQLQRCHSTHSAVRSTGTAGSYSAHASGGCPPPGATVPQHPVRKARYLH
jgi:hypothetical protein